MSKGNQKSPHTLKIPEAQGSHSIPSDPIYVEPRINEVVESERVVEYPPGN